MPSGSLRTTLRQSSTQPMAPKPSVTHSTIQTKRFDRSNHSSVAMAIDEQDQHAAHGRRAALGQVRLHAVAAHRLADLQRGRGGGSRRARPAGRSAARSAPPSRARNVRYWNTRRKPNSGESVCSHWARLSSMVTPAHPGWPACLLSCAAAGDGLHHALHLHEARALDQHAARARGTLRAARPRSSASMSSKCRAPRAERRDARAPIRVAEREQRARCRARAHRRRPRRGTAGPGRRPRPCRPAPAGAGPAGRPSTSIAARTESGLAL